MSRLPTILLRTALALGGLFVLGCIIFVMPEVTEALVESFPPSFYLPVLGAMYLAALPFYFVLYQTFKLLYYIDVKKAFSELSISALKKIKYASIVLAVLYAAILPLFYMMAQLEDAPGILAIGIVIAGSAIVIAIFSAVLQMVLQSAVEMKKENDLTV